MAEGLTAEQLMAAAHKAGHADLTSRTMTEWIRLGLLDRPARGKGRGRGAGSDKGTFPAAQRDLLLTLLDKRGTERNIRDLYPLPIGLWLYWGSDLVPTRQALRALRSWSQKHEMASAVRAKRSVEHLMSQLAHPEASPTALNALRRTLTATATGRTIPHDLPSKIRAVVDPKGVGRQLGPPGLAISPEGVVTGWLAERFAVAELLKPPAVTPNQMEQARSMLTADVVEYSILQPALAGLDSVDPFGTIKAAELRIEVLIQNSAKDILLPLAAVLRGQAT